MKTKLLALIIFGFVSLTACDLPIQPNGIKVMSVDISETEISLAVSHTRTLTATVSPTKAAIKTVNWTIEDSDIATINSSGLVTGIAEGETTVTVTTVDGGDIPTPAKLLLLPLLWKNYGMNPKTIYAPVLKQLIFTV
jgi:hypothetical protein